MHTSIEPWQRIRAARLIARARDFLDDMADQARRLDTSATAPRPSSVFGDLLAVLNPDRGKLALPTQRLQA